MYIIACNVHKTVFQNQTVLHTVSFSLSLSITFQIAQHIYCLHTTTKYHMTTERVSPLTKRKHTIWWKCVSFDYFFLSSHAHDVTFPEFACIQEKEKEKNEWNLRIGCLDWLDDYVCNVRLFFLAGTVTQIMRARFSFCDENNEC